MSAVQIIALLAAAVVATVIFVATLGDLPGMLSLP